MLGALYHCASPQVSSLPAAVFPFSLSHAGSLTDGQLVGHEVPLLMGLQYTLTVHHPYRPLRALLAAVIGAYIARADAQAGAAVVSAGAGAADASPGVAGPSLAATARGAGSGLPLLSPDDPAFVRAWDALQARAFALVDVSLATDAPFLYTPAQVAAACLILAARADALPTGSGSGAGSEVGHGVDAAAAGRAGMPQVHSAMARQLLARAHDHTAAAASVPAPDASASTHSDRRAAASRPDSPPHAPLGWWDDAALLSSAPAAVTTFVEPCVRSMIAAEATAAAAPSAPAVGLAATAQEAAEDAAEAAAIAAAEAAAAQALDEDSGEAGSAEPTLASSTAAASAKPKRGNRGARVAAIDAVTGERLSRAAAQLLSGIDHAASLVREAVLDSVRARNEGTVWQDKLADLLRKLVSDMNPAAVPGTSAYAERLAAAKEVRAAYKAEKPAARAMVAAAVGLP